MRKIGMCIMCEDSTPSKALDNEENMKLIAESGFDEVFLSFQNVHLGEEFEKYCRLARQNHLDIDFVHLGYRVAPGIASIWEEESSGDELVEAYKKDLDVVAKHGIKKVCMHVTKSNLQSPMSNIGIRRWKEIVEHAEKLGIDVCLENTVWPGYLEFINKNIASPNLKFCFDSGHNHAHFKDTYPFELFRDKIACLHLHDNDGTADQHLLPFDGSINWNKVVDSLYQAGYDGSITSESVYHGDYTSTMTKKDFYSEVYARLDKIRAMFKEKDLERGNDD